MKPLLALVQQQAADEGLWFVAQFVTEDKLQQALRELHAAVELEHQSGFMSANAHIDLARYHLQAAKFAELTALLKK